MQQTRLSPNFLPFVFRFRFLRFRRNSTILHDDNAFHGHVMKPRTLKPRMILMIFLENRLFSKFKNWLCNPVFLFVWLALFAGKLFPFKKFYWGWMNNAKKILRVNFILLDCFHKIYMIKLKHIRISERIHIVTNYFTRR